MNNTNILKAIFEIRKDLKNIVADGSNPSVRAKYATIKGIMEILQPEFNKHNLLFTSEFGTLNEQPGVLSHLIWLGGAETERIDLFFPIKEIADSQRMGAAMTYGRRYNLGALFNLTFEEDDDTGDTEKPVAKKEPQPLNF